MARKGKVGSGQGRAVFTPIVLNDGTHSVKHRDMEQTPVAPVSPDVAEPVPTGASASSEDPRPVAADGSAAAAAVVADDTGLDESP